MTRWLQRIGAAAFLIAAVVFTFAWLGMQMYSLGLHCLVWEGC